MKDTLEKKKRKHSILSGIVRTANALTLFVPQIMGKAISIPVRNQIRRMDWAKKGYKKLPASDPLFIHVQKQATAHGVEVENVYLNSNPKKINAATVNIEEDKAVVMLISFDPSRHKDGNRLLDGIIAHELSHVKNNDGIRRAKDGMLPLATILLTSVIARRVLPKKWGMTPSVVLGVGAGIGIGLLKTAVARQEEYIADLEGAQATGDPDAMIKVMEMLLKQQKQLGRKPGPVLELFLDHPPLEERIACLREAFNLASNPPSPSTTPDAKDEKDNDGKNDPDNNPGPPAFHIS